MPDVTIDELKRLLVDNCVLKVDLDQIGPDTSLFGPESIGLDSLDALQMTVAIEQNYGIAITDPQVARKAFASLRTMQEWISHQPSREPEKA